MMSLTLALVRQRYSVDGGAERFVSRTLAALQNHPVNMVLVARQWQAVQGVRLLPCNPFYLGSVWRDWGFARCACALLAQYPVDLVQSHERLSCCDIYRAGDGVHREWLKQRRRRLGRWGRLRLALNPYHHYVQFAERKLFASRRLRAVICNSRMVKDEIIRYFSLPEDRLHVIYNDVDTNLFHPGLRESRAATRARHAIPADAMVFLLVGSGFERKGVRLLLDALAELPDAAHLLVVGKDKKMRDFLIQAEQLKIAGRVHFTGAQQDVTPFYGAADVFVLPTLYDPFPNAALEAMASGLPVITSSKCGAAELIQNSNSGYVCDALDKNKWVEAMQDMFVSEYRCASGDAARRAAEQLSEKNMAQQLLALYQNLLSAQL